nr:DUF2637 domain-containing protein [Actinoplanes subtropicus]
MPARPARHEPPDEQTSRWKRLRWGVRGALVVGVAASVAANMLHARSNPISQAIAAWPPLALLLTVELISRVPVYRRSLAAVRLLATTVIAGIAAWVSYWHMTAVAARYGETAASPYLLPLSVDGLIVVASICLVELSGRIDANDRTPPNPPPAPAHPTRTVTAAQPADAAPPAPTATPHTAPGSFPAPAARNAKPTGAEPRTDPATGAHDGPPADAGERAQREPSKPAEAFAEDGATTASADAGTAPATAVPETPVDRADDIPADPPQAPQQTPPHDDRDIVPTETGAAVAYWLQRDPNMHPNDIAARIGKSSRQVRRYMAADPAGDRRRINGEQRKLPTDT